MLDSGGQKEGWREKDSALLLSVGSGDRKTLVLVTSGVTSLCLNLSLST